MVSPMRIHDLVRTRVGGMALSLLLTAPFIALPSADTTKGPDASGYTGTDNAVFSFVDVAASGGAGVLADTDDGTAVLTLPFAFTFYGQAYTLMCVSSNGAAYFISDLADCQGLLDFANTDPTSTTTPGDHPALFPLWSDLRFEGLGSGVYYQANGVPGSRRFVLQWNRAYPLSSPNPVTFQAILFEGSNQVLFQYETVAVGGSLASNGGEATVGIRNAGAPANGQQIAWSYKAPVLADGLAVLYTGSRAAFTFTGFFAPIDMPTETPIVWNVARAGQTIPVKWRLMQNGVPVADTGSFLGLFSSPVKCDSGAIDATVEQYVSGNSTLMYLGDGLWQYNWRTQNNARNTCHAMHVKFCDNTVSPTAYFKFR